MIKSMNGWSQVITEVDLNCLAETLNHLLSIIVVIIIIISFIAIQTDKNTVWLQI